MTATTSDIRSLRLKLHNDRRPRAPITDLRLWLMIVPSCISALGLCCFAILALAFTEIRQLPMIVRHTLIITGGVAVAVGGELGTPVVAVEVFRKRGNGTVSLWDWFFLVISLLATLASFLVAFAALLVVAGEVAGMADQTVWAPVTEIWGPIVIGLLVAMDAYAGFSEMGMYLGDRDRRMEEWVNELEELEIAINGSGDESAYTRPEYRPGSSTPSIEAMRREISEAADILNEEPHPAVTRFTEECGNDDA